VTLDWPWNMNAIPSQTKWNTKSKKHSCKNNVCSQRGVTWQTDAICLWSVTLTSPLIFFHWGSYNNNSPWTFRYNLVNFWVPEQAGNFLNTWATISFQ
jgi:hypothetical protein